MRRLRARNAAWIAGLTLILIAVRGWGALPEVPVPPENPITEAKRILGKILFWEEQLSSDDTVACGTCHIPSAAGADPRQGVHPGPDGIFDNDDDVIGSPGVVRRDASNAPVNDAIFGLEPQVTGRAAQAYFLSMYAEDNFWDGRAASAFVDPLDGSVLIESGGGLESQAVGPIVSSVEMAHEGRTWGDVTAKLADVQPLALARNLPPDMAAALAGGQGYAELFAAAFGDFAITPARIAMAIATYERTLIPDQTPWDLFMAGDNTAMTENQQRGWQTFEESTVCDNCHVPPLFSDNEYHNIGLRPADEDLGRQSVTGVAGDAGRFRTPSLRNVGLKKSLMHVGWITGVKDSIDFYNAGTTDTGHVQFTADQSGIPTNNPGQFVDYDTLSLPEFTPGGIAVQEPFIDFIENALTDPRVAAEQFPFDRPMLRSEQIVEGVSSNAQLSGSWFDITHDGEGWLIEILDGDVVVVYWFTYDADGNQMWLVGVGTIVGDTLTIDELLVTSGPGFGPGFDPDDVVGEVWGSLVIIFTGCDTATLDYVSVLEFGSGSFSLIRLTALAGLSCG